jgi:hypothetical protein
MIMNWQNLEPFQPSKHYSQLATMILGNNLFGMASLPQERALPSFYFHYFYPHVTTSQYSHCTSDFYSVTVKLRTLLFFAQPTHDHY